MIPALAMSMLIVPKCAFAWAMHAEIDSSEEISPVTVNRFGDDGRLVIGRRSWAVTLHPWSRMN